MARRPRIGFDLSPQGHAASLGVRRAALELWRALGRRRERFTWVPIAAERGPSPRVWRQLVLPWRIARERLDGFHSTVSALPWLARCVLVQTVHELPWRSGAVENAGVRHRTWARSRRARATVVPSVFTRRALAAERGGDERGITVVPWGVGPPFTTTPLVAGGREPLVVAVGATRPKKRLDLVLEIVASCAAAREQRIVVTGDTRGDEDWLAVCRSEAHRLGVAERLDFAGALTDLELARLLARASVAIVASDSEGFGLPALEAAACGAPVVVRALGAAEEAAGAAAVPFASGAKDGAAALARALAVDATVRDDFARAARTRTWDVAAERIEALWSTLVS
jgi:glycosyltransferase involved in cell wall biosynthesis